MNLRNHQTGFPIIKVIILVIGIILIGFGGYLVYSYLQGNNVIEMPTVTDVNSAPTIESTSDLDKAQKLLDQTDPSSSNNNDLKQLDNVSNF